MSKPTKPGAYTQHCLDKALGDDMLETAIFLDELYRQRSLKQCQKILKKAENLVRKYDHKGKK